jgi:aspartyl/asparaginyl beta-hydroxylase (cupin superfamily)
VNFQTYLWRYHRASAAFPFTVGLLDTIPGLVSAFINVLEPNAAVPPHWGDSNTIMRCHLGLDVPPGDCGIRVGPETRRWSNGALLAFSDAHEHTSWNATGARRVVLVLDVLLPEYRDRERWICANVLSSTVVVWLEARLRIFQRARSLDIRRSGRTVPFPRPVRTILRRAIGLGFYLWLPIQRRGTERVPLVPDTVPAR